jgi:Protein of unknown function (DUF2637)
MRTRWAAGLVMAGLAIVAAVISYNDGLFLVRFAGASGRLAYLYPLLPDGLIVISSISLYEAATSGQPRPKWATTGLVLGGVLTLAMNFAAGYARGPLLAGVDSAVPVVFFVALEILIGLIRRSRAVPAPVPAASNGHQPLPSVRELRATHSVSQATAYKMRTALRTYTAASNGHGGGDG